MKRFRMRIDRWWRPLLLVAGATSNNSYVEMTNGDVNFRFGLIFNRTIPKTEIEAVYRRSWPWWMGVGWRSNLRGVVGLIGSYDGVVEVKLREKQRAWGVFPCDRIAISLRDPDAFVEALGGETAAAAPAKTPARRRKKAG